MNREQRHARQGARHSFSNRVSEAERMRDFGPQWIKKIEWAMWHTADRDQLLQDFLPPVLPTHWREKQ